MGYMKIENGEITTVKELLLDVCTGYNIKIIDGVIQYRAPSNHYKEQLEKITKEYIDFQNQTDEEIQKDIDESFIKITQERQDMIIYYKDKKDKYDNMIKQLKLWKHTKACDNMYNNIMEELKKDYEFSKEMIIEYGKEYKKETLEEYKTNMIKYYLEKIKRYSNNYASEIEETEKNNKIIKEFEDSLKELDSVSIEDELHTPKEAYNTSFSSHDCCTIGKCPNCNSFVDSYKNKCSCGQVLKW